LVLSRVLLIRVRLVLVNLNPINDTYIQTELGSACGTISKEEEDHLFITGHGFYAIKSALTTRLLH